MVFFISVLIGILIGAVCLSLGYFSEKRAWNYGICARTGEPWEYFDTDSQGGRGYRSKGHIVWVSYPGIDTKYKWNKKAKV